ncbi:MAG: hypothetical protein JXA54_10780 [Candidatus Heimdallarchaeota archaeon]|nr:hypothetical protein [Candidatus Heimdallarchaeota archaeon]
MSKENKSKSIISNLIALTAIICSIILAVWAKNDFNLLYNFDKYNLLSVDRNQIPQFTISFKDTVYDNIDITNIVIHHNEQATFSQSNYSKPIIITFPDTTVKILDTRSDYDDSSSLAPTISSKNNTT